MTPFETGADKIKEKLPVKYPASLENEIFTSEELLLEASGVESEKTCKAFEPSVEEP